MCRQLGIRSSVDGVLFWRSEHRVQPQSGHRFAIDICLMRANHTEHAPKGHCHGDDL